MKSRSESYTLKVADMLVRASPIVQVQLHMGPRKKKLQGKKQKFNKNYSHSKSTTSALMMSRGKDEVSCPA